MARLTPVGTKNVGAFTGFEDSLNKNVSMRRSKQPERERRIALQAEAQLVTADGARLPVTFKDLSRRGFKVEHLAADLIEGEVVTLATQRSEARAQLHWVTSKEAGGTFIDDVDELFS